MNDCRSDGLRRTVITGMGVISVIGDSLDAYFDSLSKGRSGITRWKKMDQRIYSKIGGDLSDFDLDAHLGRVGASYPQGLVQRAKKLLRATPLPGTLSAAAAAQAWVDAGFGDKPVAPERFAHVLAGHNLAANYIVENVRAFADEPEFIDPLFGLMSMDSDALSVISELLSVKGPSFTVGGACASSNLAMLSALDLIRAGRADAVLVSGAAADLDPVILQGWSIIDALTYKSFNDDPASASRPFDRRREGFVPSEGAGALIFESLASARRRGASIHAETLGASSASDACRLTKPDRDGQVRAMTSALLDARVDAAQVDYVNAHATSTPLGDAVEVAAIKTVLKERAYRVPVNSTKSMVGHCLTAAGAVEMIATVLQMERGLVHPTINHQDPDPELGLDFVPNQGREQQIHCALSNSFGFGGLNSCVIVGRRP